AGTRDALGREDDALEGGMDVRDGDRLAVMEFDVLADLEGVALAPVRRLRHLGAGVADVVLGSLVLRVDADQRAVEGSDGMRQRKRRLPMAIEARRFVR